MKGVWFPGFHLVGEEVGEGRGGDESSPLNSYCIVVEHHCIHGYATVA